MKNNSMNLNQVFKTTKHHYVILLIILSFFLTNSLHAQICPPCEPPNCIAPDSQEYIGNMYPTVSTLFDETITIGENSILYIDKGFRFQGCIIEMGQNAQIVVLAGKLLRLYSSTVLRCGSENWETISLGNNSKLRVRNSNISGGNKAFNCTNCKFMEFSRDSYIWDSGTAVTANGFENIWFKGSTIDKCTYGFDVGSGDYLEITNDPIIEKGSLISNIKETAIETDVLDELYFGQASINPEINFLTEIKKCKTGIDGNGTDLFRIQNGHFTNCSNMAVYSSSIKVDVNGAVVRTCETAFDIDAYDIKIVSSTIEDAISGIKASGATGIIEIGFNAIEIKDHGIDSPPKVGIEINNSSEATILVSTNTISVIADENTTNPNPTGISLKSASDPTYSLLAWNEINCDPCTEGIHVQRRDRVELLYNKVVLNSSTNSDEYGIFIERSDNVYLDTNIVTSSIDIDEIDINTKGIYVDNSTGWTISKNVVSGNLGAGFSFEDDCTSPEKFTSNHIIGGGMEIGLAVGQDTPNSKMGSQSCQDNEWVGVFSVYGAELDPGSIPGESAFDVNTLPPSLFPTILWFDQIACKKSSVKPRSSNEFREEQFKIYPNPASSQLTIQNLGLEESDSFRFKLYDLAGKLKYENIMFFKSNYQSIDLPSELSGMYLLQLSSNNLLLTKRLMID